MIQKAAGIRLPIRVIRRSSSYKTKVKVHYLHN